jgi:outer membrane protein W
MLTKPDETKDVDIRPYVGAGMSYVSTSRPRTTAFGEPPTLQRFSGTGGQVFGGIEMTFKEADWITISAEGIYYKMPVHFVNSAVIGGFNYLMAIHFYLK